MNLTDLISALSSIHEIHGDLAVFVGEDILQTVQVELNDKDEATCVILTSDEDDGEDVH